MSIARAVVSLGENLRGASQPIDLFQREARPALMANAAAASLITALTRTGVADPLTSLLLSLQALQIQRSVLEPHLIDAAFVATVPGEVPQGARPTALVVREMLMNAGREIIALGYEVTHDDVLEDLARAAARGVAVSLICDRGRLQTSRLRGLESNGVTVYVDTVGDDDAPYAKMHCKCLLVDERDLLITSANFTFHGLHGNIEFGVRLRGEPCTGARSFFEHLVKSGFLEKLDDMQPVA